MIFIGARKERAGANAPDKSREKCFEHLFHSPRCSRLRFWRVRYDTIKTTNRKPTVATTKSVANHQLLSSIFIPFITLLSRSAEART